MQQLSQLRLVHGVVDLARISLARASSRRGFGVSVESAQGNRAVVENLQQPGVIGAKRVLFDGQRAFQHEFGVRVTALRKVESAEVVQSVGEIGVIGTERLLVDQCGTTVQQLGDLVLAFRTIDLGEVVGIRGDGPVLFAVIGLVKCQGVLEPRLGGVVFPLLEKYQAEIGQVFGCLLVAVLGMGLLVDGQSLGKGRFRFRVLMQGHLHGAQGAQGGGYRRVVGTHGLAPFLQGL